jgi:hypothetical protein
MIAVASVILVVPLSLCFGVSSAAAAVEINKYCSLHAYLPHEIATNRYEVSGAIECEFFIEEMEIEVWSEVWNPTQSKWFPITGTYSSTTYYDAEYGGWQNAIDGVPGHEYRTADWGWVYDSNFPSPHYQSNTYHSSGWTCC